MSYLEETAILKAHTLVTDIPDKLFKAKIRPCFIIRDICEGYHSLRMGFRDSTSPVVGYCALMLTTTPAATVKGLYFTGIDIQPMPDDILTIVGR